MTASPPPPEQKNATSLNGVVALVMFVAVIVAAGVLYGTLEEPAPKPAAAVSPPPPAPTAPITPAPPAPPVASPPETPKRIVAKPRSRPNDGLIQSQVVTAILDTPRIHGDIRVSARNAVVTLTGWTLTRGEALRAVRAARRVKDVRVVENRIRPVRG